MAFKTKNSSCSKPEEMRNQEWWKPSSIRLSLKISHYGHILGPQDISAFALKQTNKQKYSSCISLTHVCLWQALSCPALPTPPEIICMFPKSISCFYNNNSFTMTSTVLPLTRDCSKKLPPNWNLLSLMNLTRMGSIKVAKMRCPCLRISEVIKCLFYRFSHQVRRPSSLKIFEIQHFHSPPGALTLYVHTNHPGVWSTAGSDSGDLQGEGAPDAACLTGSPVMLVLLVHDAAWTFE